MSILFENIQKIATNHDFFYSEPQIAVAEALVSEDEGDVTAVVVEAEKVEEENLEIKEEYA